MCNKVLRTPIVEEDIKRFVRLGKADSVQPGKGRPILIQFRDRIHSSILVPIDSAFMISY